MNPREIKYHTEKLGIDNNGKVFLYKYIDFKGAVSLIEKCCFKFSNPKDFNDPFDLYDELIDFKKFEPINNFNRTRFERRKIERTPINIIEKKLRIEWKKHKRNFGLSCFSKNFDNILMWSHYADKHQGVCIGLEINANKLMNDGFLTFPVEYEETFTPKPYFDKDEKIRADIIMRYLSTKASFWDYEQEVRIVDFYYFQRFSSQFLNFTKYAEIKKIFLGLKMGDSNKKKIKNMIKGLSGLSIFEMKTTSNKFGLTFK